MRIQTHAHTYPEWGERRGRKVEDRVRKTSGERKNLDYYCTSNIKYFFFVVLVKLSDEINHFEY